MGDAETVKIAGVQMEPAFANPSINRRLILERLEAAADQGARLMVFPECALTGYAFDSREEAIPFAETLPGPSSDAVATECARLGGVHALFGLLERDGDLVFNACALVGPDGLVATYRKIHLPFMGVDRFVDPGDRPFGVTEAAGVKIGMHICYDGAFPESGRVMSLMGAELLALPTNWPTKTEAVAEHLPPCRAMENVVYMIAVNRIGEERGARFIGRSSIAGPGGEILARASSDREEILVAEIEPALSRQKRLIRIPGIQEVDRIRDRRPDFYREIVEPVG